MSTTELLLKLCFTWFLTLGELNFHKLSHNPSPPPTCYMCVQRKFSSREQLRDHLREKHTQGSMLDGAELKLHKAKSSSGKGSILTSLEVLHKTETTKNVEMHPNCKDPSRDCHHCGKQFPKPFKLQRHLVVHNLERIFLCHKCPVSYQEAQELKEHLKSAHEEAEEFESKHTTLYTCELCADVMHVIKKSFICKQFDRHMEKHLSGGNKIFKFRGVLRPVTPSASKENECDSPASKKRRILSDSLTENSSDSGIASVSSLHLSQSIDIQPSKPSVATADDSTQTAANEYHNDTTGTNVKTEDIAEDSSGLLEEQERHIQLSPPEFTTPKKEESDPTLSPDPLSHQFTCFSCILHPSLPIPPFPSSNLPFALHPCGACCCLPLREVMGSGADRNGLLVSGNDTQAGGAHRSLLPGM
uniref:C2H2-type domain-containing protein n=1 Tax=Oryzias latipes TaxID=8090 RepID=A0A3P9LGU3_ORYLA